VSVRYGFLEIGVDAYNLFDAQYAASEYSFVSNWQTSTYPSLVPARHVGAGAPLTMMLNVGVTL
jgi:iron complex outermembrane receptor protein